VFGLKRFKVRTRFNAMVRPMLEPLFVDIESIIVQQQFTTSLRDFIVLCQVNWNKRMDDVEGTARRLVQGLERFSDVVIISTDKRRTLCFVMGKYNEMYTELFTHTTKEYLCFIEFPVTLRKDGGLLNLIGPPKDVERLLAFMREWGTELEVIGIKDYHSRDKGLLTVLTNKQLAVLKCAYERGFFDHPRKADARKLAGRMGMKHTTFLTHIRKAQKRLLDELFGE